MKQINITSYKTEATEIINRGLYKQAVCLMDDDIREYIHSCLSPCDDVAFLSAYMAVHKARYKKNFMV